MVPLLGNITLWLSLVFSVLQFIISFKKNINLFKKFKKVAVNGFLFSITISFFSLMYCYVNSDFSVSNVYENSHTTKPLIYKISAVWGNHEGSMVLWILILSIFNYYILKLYNEKKFLFVLKILETQSLISIGFILFTILTSNPFNILSVVPSDGLGFNPILQDPALAAHPPLLYIGYVGCSAGFSISVAILSLKNSENLDWFKCMKPFVLSSWSFLTIGIALGSLWAYYELGWGGWWFWDPVENASLMPWLLSTALIHSLITVEKRKSLRAWVLLLAILTFLLSIIGTFLVRSGILTSVHTFALDPSRGIYILSLIGLLGGYSLILYALKSKNYLGNNLFNFFSKEGAILFNNIIMVIVCSSVFLGTIYPLLVEAFSNNKISVGEPYYNSIVVPIIIPAILVMGIGPILSWKKDDVFKILKKMSPNIFFTLLITFIFFYIYKSHSILGFFGILISVWIMINNFLLLFNKIKNKNKIKKMNLQDTKNYSIGMILSHLGVGILILGITGSSVWQGEKIVRMKINSNISINNYNIVFDKIDEIKGKNYIAIQGNFTIYDQKNSIVSILNPENRFYPITKGFTSEASIHTNLVRDLYIVLGEGNLSDGWVVKIYYNPLVIWIWIGVLIIFCGGILSLNRSFKKIKFLSV
jgi:cytochrome c-type biogenesis protein CcmF